MALSDFALPQITPLGAARGYNIANVSLTVFGVAIREFAKDSKIGFEKPDGKVEFLEDMVGGSGIFAMNPSQKGILKFSLAGQGDDVTLIRQIWAQAELTRTMPVGPVLLTMAGDTWTVAAEKAALSKFASMSWGTTPDPAEVAFEGVFVFTLKPASSI